MKEPKKDFENLRDRQDGEKLIMGKLKKYEKTAKYLQSWRSLSRRDNLVYPSQGLLLTPYDGLGRIKMQKLPQKLVLQTLRLRRFFLEMFNHPYRMHYLRQVNGKKFEAPPKVECRVLEKAFAAGLALSIRDIGASVVGAKSGRVRRTERYGQGPFVKLGRQGRTFFAGSASPDVWNSSMAIATMAASHCLAGIPRNGVLAAIQRQADMVREVFTRLEETAGEVLGGRKEKKEILAWWKGNVMGVVEASPEKAMARAEELYKRGIRAFRVYSPEPGTGPEETTAEMRRKFGKEIEIFAGEVVSTAQAKRTEEAGADGIFVGIGGGGRCITGVRSGSVIDWPELVWKLRGEINVPVIAEGGASDHVAATLLLGASGISVSRMVAGGTIESPGGWLYCADEEGRLFKPYGGEASARTKFLDGKLLPFGVPAFVEGETTKAWISFVKHALPTLTYNLHLSIEDAILALVFRGVENITDLQAINPSPLRQMTGLGELQMNVH